MSLKKFIKQVECLSPRATVTEACCHMDEKNVGAVVVISDDNRPMGMLTDRDIVVRVIGAGKEPQGTAVEAVMSSPVETLPLDATVEQATELMCSRKIRRVPIVDGEQHVIGLVSFDDLVLLVGLELGNLAGAVAETVAAAGAAATEAPEAGAAP